MILGQSDQRDLLVPLVPLEPTVRMESLDQRDLVVIVDLRVFAVLPALLDLRASRVRRVLRAVPDLVDSKVLPDLRVTPVLVVLSDLVVVVLLVLRDLKVSRDLRVSVVSLGLVLAVLLDLWDQRVNVVRWASKEAREMPVLRALKVSLAAMVSRVTRVLQVLWAAPVFVALRVTAA